MYDVWEGRRAFLNPKGIKSSNFSVGPDDTKKYSIMHRQLTFSM